MVRPVAWVGQPHSWPGSASIGKVDDVEDEETVVVLVLRRQSSGVAAGRCVCFCIIHAEDSVGGRSEGQVHLCALVWIAVVHETLRWVVVNKVIEVSSPEIFTLKGIFDRVVQWIVVRIGIGVPCAYDSSNYDGYQSDDDDCRSNKPCL